MEEKSLMCLGGRITEALTVQLTPIPWGHNEMSGYSPDFYYFIGECYLQGHMDGVSFEKMAAGQKEPEVFHLV
jgi:hypothetical protein